MNVAVGTTFQKPCSSETLNDDVPCAASYSPAPQAQLGNLSGGTALFSEPVAADVDMRTVKELFADSNERAIKKKSQMKAKSRTSFPKVSS